MNFKPFIFSIFVASLSLFVFSQENQSLEKQIADLTKKIPELNNEVNISLSDASIQEFTRMVAMNSGVNITVDPNLDIRIINEFNDVKVGEILVYLCEEYDLEINNIGSIISLKKKITEKVKKEVKKEIKITYNDKTELLNLDLRRDSLFLVAKKITSLTGENVIISPELHNNLVSCYVINADVKKALESIVYSNNLQLETTSNGFYNIVKRTKVPETKPIEKEEKKPEDLIKKNNSNYSWYINENGLISINTKEGNIRDIIELISDTLNVSYSFVSDINGIKNINFQNVPYNEFLSLMLNNTEYSFHNKQGTYFIGKKAKELFMTTDLIYLNYRGCESIQELIPSNLKKSVEIIEATEYNALIVTGSEQDVYALKCFINDIDKTIPVIQIEILIVDIQKDYSISTGITAGTGDVSTESSQTFLPGLDYKLSTETINNFVEKINGIGWINLGKVSSDFYLTLQALEDNSVLKINSTPKLATLNGVEAELSSGETQYYKEETSNYIGTTNPSLSTSYTWQEISADLDIKIKPIVSGDDQITLEIEVTQDEFQEVSSTDEPPGSVTRSFKSIIRVKNEEMVLLGGLDKLTKLDASSGWPLLSRIPIIKWFFSSRTKTKNDDRLSIFIKPTIIY